MAGIPKQYAFLGAVGLMPRGITHALSLLGTNEIPGKGSNPVIDAWRTELKKAGVSGVDGFSDDSVPWCGLFNAIVTLRAGKTPINNPLWAQNWQSYGTEIARNMGTLAKPKLVFQPSLKASLGDTLVFARKTATGFAGHVGRYIAEDATAYHVIGGNQGDTVSITRVLKSRCIAVRRDAMTTPPQSLRPFQIAANGTVGTSEA